jgi:hypothetical protein
MRAIEVLQNSLSNALGKMHASRSQVLCTAVDALIAGRRLTLIDMARAWPNAGRVRAPLKALDRLLSNAHLQGERMQVYAAMAERLANTRQPLIVVDWCDLKADRSWHLLRAAVPVGGRTLPLLDMVFANGKQGSPQAERVFLQRLAEIVPAGVQPILITDAGFRAPWFRAVAAMGWEWLGRLRHTTQVKPAHVKDEADQWVPCKALHALAGATPRDMGKMDIARYQPLNCRMALLRKRPRGRKHRTRQGRPARNSNSRKNAAREREPWILVASPTLSITAAQMTATYAKRMQIELSFRDLKSHRYGQGFEDSLTRIGKRIEILLLIQALAAFVCWLVGRLGEQNGLDTTLAPHGCRRQRRWYSLMRLGQELLQHDWLRPRLSAVFGLLKNPPSALLGQMALRG